MSVNKKHLGRGTRGRWVRGGAEAETEEYDINKGNKVIKKH